MSDRVWLLRLGETEWTQDGRHTGREDVPLSDPGASSARRPAACRRERCEGACLLIAHGKLLRAPAARWVRLTVAYGSILPMDPAAISLLEREHGSPLLRLWNITGQLVAQPG